MKFIFAKQKLAWKYKQLDINVDSKRCQFPDQHLMVLFKIMYYVGFKSL